MYWLSGFVYRQADQVVVLGPYMADRIALKGVAPERIATIPVWSRRDEIYPTPRDANPLRKALGLERRLRRDVLGKPRPGPLVRRVHRGGPAAPRPPRHRLPVRRAKDRGWAKSRPPAIARD